jgi:DNA-binding response OmpR family regulator/DNA-binding CsgD family transcriptional regulator
MSGTVLVVDDDADTRALLRDFLAGEGYRHRLAGSGEEALAAVGARLPDLILLDAVMPGLDGFETCRRIKRRDDAAAIPVIFMTGLSETVHVVMGLGAGGVDYVTKPLQLDQLAARIRVHLANARRTRGALDALDSVGSKVLSCDGEGRIAWATPDARRLLGELEPATLDALQALLANMSRPGVAAEAAFGGELQRLSLTRLEAVAGEHRFRIGRSLEGREPRLLQDAFGLTPREADVLLWTSRGKSNKDMSEILNISARTVNKHLEQIFIKVGVENRASATAAATRVLFSWR